MIIIYIIGILFWILVLGWIIERSSRSKQIVRQLMIQNKLLAHIARTQGVEQSVITSALTDKFYIK
jgi:hypothetical protein